jgi:hypothetical protein
MMINRTPVFLLIFGLAVAACCKPPCGPAPRAEGIPTAKAARKYDRGTRKQQTEIAKLIASIPCTQGAERIEVGRLIVAFGEPAMGQLVEALGNPSADTRNTAAWCLGFLGDPRAADALYGSTMDCDKFVRLEAASSLLKLQDRRGWTVIIRGLDDGDPRVRAKCIALLEQMTGETFGYRADQVPTDRAAAVSRWRAWAAQQRTACSPGV